jgi:hypothetical protein
LFHALFTSPAQAQKLGSNQTLEILFMLHCMTDITKPSDFAALVVVAFAF